MRTCANKCSKLSCMPARRQPNPLAAVCTMHRASLQVCSNVDVMAPCNAFLCRALQRMDLSTSRLKEAPTYNAWMSKLLATAKAKVGVQACAVPLSRLAQYPRAACARMRRRSAVPCAYNPYHSSLSQPHPCGAGVGTASALRAGVNV